MICISGDIKFTSNMTTIGEYLEQKGNDTDRNDLRKTLRRKEFGYAMTDDLGLVAERRAPGLAAKLLDDKFGLSFKIVSGLIKAGDTAARQECMLIIFFFIFAKKYANSQHSILFCFLSSLSQTVLFLFCLFSLTYVAAAIG